jgi:EAL domain-containing protein (putative c-di-GMP-specific phosphodiesterase class I)
MSAQAIPVAAPAAKRNISELHFLVAEDHEFQRKALVAGLKSIGARHILEAADGVAALEYFSDLIQPIDIIICDLEMPNMDGMAFIRHVGEAGTPVSLILASAMDRSVVASVETMTRAYGLNMLGAIEKPATPKKLKALIERHGVVLQPAGQKAAEEFPVNEIVAAMEQRQFVPYFQPKVDIASGKLVGAESLVRWRHPQRGIQPPGTFLDTIERKGMMDELTWMMLEKSAAHCVGWQAQGFPVTVSVNLSVASLEDPAFADRVVKAVEKQQLAPKYMTLEITESVAMTNVANCLEGLARLRMKGFGLSIDDYGTGHSSLQQLARIPFTELKIDQSFVTHCAANTQNRTMLESSIDMARKLGIKSVGEGVETLDDWNLLKQLGCDIAQGYYLAKPMPNLLFNEWMRDWNASA